MLKRVLSDYIRSFTWRKLIQNSDTNNNDISWGIMYLFFILPVIELPDESLFGIASYYLWVIPFIVGMRGMALLPFQIPKMMFLCPTNLEERRQYLKYVYWVRILVPIMLEVLLGTVLILFGIVTLDVVVVFAVNIASILVVFSKLTKNIHSSDDWIYNSCYVIWFLFSVVAQMCTIMFMEEVIKGNDTYRYALIAEIMVFMVIDVFCLRSLPKSIEKNSGYGEHFDMIKPQNQPGKAR